ncbi:hypothetical protein HDV00_004264 [Rhizophlyctis rosea]|nr:hypothetical protein HDV00_004264 [Rhizophlyctis rosea]
MSLTVTIPAQTSSIVLPPFNPSLPSIPASPPMEIPATYKQDYGSYFPNPPSPPARAGRLSVDSTSSEETLEEKPKKMVSFNAVVDVTETYTLEEYDRSPISVDPLTRDDIAFVLRYRAEMHRATIDLYRRRHYLEMQQQQRETAQQQQQQVLIYTHQRQQSLPHVVRPQHHHVRSGSLSAASPVVSTTWRKPAALTGPAFQPCF